MFGIPGSAYLGAPLLEAVESAAIAPGGRWVFAGGRGFLRNRANSALIQEPVPGMMDGVERAAWSVDGLAAVLYSPSRHAIQRVSSQGGGLVAGEPAGVASLGETLTALAIESAAGRVAAGFGEGLYLLTPDGQPAPLAARGRHTAAVFSPDGAMVAAIDSTARQVVIFRGLPPAVEAIDLAAEHSEPLGLAFSPDGARLVVADAACACLRIYEFGAGRVVGETPLEAAPTGLQALSGSSVYLLRRQAPVLVLDFRPLPAVYFVPASVPEAL